MKRVEKAGLKLTIQNTKKMASGPMTLWQVDGENTGNSDRFYFLGSRITVDGDCSHKIKRCLLASWKKRYDKPRQCIKKQRHHFANKGLSSQSYGFSSSHVWMWELDHKEGWASKNWCLWTLVLEKTLESPLDGKEIKPVNPKGNQPWIFIEGLILKLQYFVHLIWRVNSLGKKNLGKDTGKDWGQEGKGAAEDEMVRYHYWLNGHEFEQTPGDSEGHDLVTEQKFLFICVSNIFSLCILLTCLCWFKCPEDFNFNYKMSNVLHVSLMAYTILIFVNSFLLCIQKDFLLYFLHF